MLGKIYGKGCRPRRAYKALEQLKPSSWSTSRQMEKMLLFGEVIEASSTIRGAIATTARTSPSISPAPRKRDGLEQVLKRHRRRR